MKNLNRLAVIVLAILLAAAFACKKEVEAPSDIAVFDCGSTDKVVNADRVTVDKTVTSDGNGSLKVATETPLTVQLFEVPYPKAQDSELTFKAKIKTSEFGGDAYLQMIVHFPNGGSLNAQNYQNAIRGTTDWTELSTSVVIQPGQKPDSVNLNLVVNGVGTVWVDDIHLVKAPRVAQ
jgi:hypothetical protein